MEVLFSSLISLTIKAFCFWYAFFNPDRKAWYGIDPSTNEEKLFESPSSLGDDTELLDIHSRYVVWFRWALFSLFSPYLIVLVMLFLNQFSADLSSFCGILMACNASCAGVACYITGLVWRFGEAGAFAAGDTLIDWKLAEQKEMLELTGTQTLFQLQSAKCVLYFYIASWVICCLACLESCFIACCTNEN